MSKRKSSSGRWLQRQRRDPFVRQAQQSGWRSRAVFKLEQIDQRDQLIKPGQYIADLGCAPGGWSQYALKKLRGQGRVIGLDLLPVADIAGLHYRQGDFLAEESIDWIASLCADNQGLDLVLSDMAPNLSGNRLLDQARSLELLDAAAAFCRRWLKPGGALLAKAFQGEDLPEYAAGLKADYATVAWRKPAASRDESREVFLLARGRRIADNP